MATRFEASKEVLTQDRLGGPLVEAPLNIYEFATDQLPRAVLSPGTQAIVENRRHILHATFAGLGDLKNSVLAGKPLRAIGDLAFGVVGGVGKDGVDALTGKDTKIIRNAA